MNTSLIALSTRDRRTLVLGAVVISVLILFVRGLPTYRAWISETRTDAANQVRLAARVDEMLSGARTTRDTLMARNARYLTLATALVPGVTSAEASASLASLVSAAATNAGVKLGAVQLRPVTDTSPHHAFVRVGVHADFVGDVRGLASMLIGLEGGSVRLRVRELTVNAENPASPRDRVEIVRGDLVVEGLAVTHQ